MSTPDEALQEHRLLLSEIESVSMLSSVEARGQDAGFFAQTMLPEALGIVGSALTKLWVPGVPSEPSEALDAISHHSLDLGGARLFFDTRP